MAKLSFREWRATPYADSTAKRTTEQVSALMTKYKITEYSQSVGTGISGRKGYGVQFVLRGKRYQVGFDTLDAHGVPEEQLMVQVQRAVYHHLKSLLEAGSVFVQPEETMMPYLVLPNGSTLFDTLKPNLEKLQAEGTGALLLK